MTVIRGRSGDDNLSGTTGDDTFNLTRGGNDTVFGDAGNDTFWMGATLNAADRIDGGTGTDTVTLNGDYSAGLVFDADTIVSIEKLFLHNGHDYNLTMNDGNVAAGGRLTIGAASLGAGDTLTFDGSAELDGRFAIAAGAGDDVITGGAKADRIDLGKGGTDTVHGGGGNDTILMGSSLTSADTIDGGTGNDSVFLTGMGDDSVFFSATTMTGVETLVLGAGSFYTLISNDATVAAGATLTVDGSALTGSNSFSFTGSAETDGAFHFIGGGSNLFQISGGAGNDVFDMTAIQAAASTTLAGNGGIDTFEFAGNFDSSSQAIDGGAGSDVLSLNGDYSDISLVGGVIASVEKVTFAAGHDYTGIQVFDSVSSDTTLLLDASALTASDDFDADATNATQGITFLAGAGTYTVAGSSLADMFELGAHFGAADSIAGGGGFDTAVLDGDYTGANALSITSGMMSAIGDLVVVGSHAYELALADDSVAGTGMVIDAGTSSGGLTFDGSAETTSAFTVYDSSGDDSITTGGGGDQINLENGGTDTVHAGDGDDAILATGTLTAADTIDGGAGTDTLVLDGDYSAGLTLGATTVTNVEEIDLSGGHSYNLTTDEATVATNDSLTVNASALGAGDALTFDGSAETDGYFVITGGAGDDVIIGGQDGDLIDLSYGGNDTVTLGSTLDIFPNEVDMGAALTAADHIDGSAGFDIMDLEGDYTGAHAVTFDATTIIDVEVLEFGAGFSYDLTSNDGNLSAGSIMEIDGSFLGVGDSLKFDGSAETDGSFFMNDGLGNDVLKGGAGDDDLSFDGGGTDIGVGGGGDDFIDACGHFDSTDQFDGGDGANDAIELTASETDTGNYTGADALVLTASMMTNIEQMLLDNGGSYDITTVDGNVAAGSRLTVDGSILDTGDSLTFNGAAETDGAFDIFGGAGNDTLTGGAQADTFDLSTGGSDTVHAGDSDDYIYAGGKLEFSDAIDGGAGTDTVEIAGMGDDSIVFTATTMINVEQLLLDAGFFYSLVTADATVASGATLTVDGSALGAGDELLFNGAAETDGAFTLVGGADGDSLTGGAQADTFDLSYGGNDTANGGAGDDNFSFGAAFTASDQVDGGADGDTISLDGDYSAGVTMAAATMTAVETIAVAAGNSYSLTTVDANVAAGATLTVDGSALGAGDSLSFDGSAETDGHFSFTGGSGNDTLSGGAQSDTFDLTAGGDETAHGGGGNDTFSFGGTFAAADTVDGGTGSDTLDLNGDYSALTTIADTAVTNIETLVIEGSFLNNLLVTGDVTGGGGTLTIDAGTATAETDIDLSAATTANFVFTGGAGDDFIIFGANFTAADQIDGGGASFFGNQLVLHGDYSGGNALVFNADTIQNISQIDLVDGFDYDITLDAGNVTGTNSIGINPTNGTLTGTLRVDASAFTTQGLEAAGGDGDDNLIGGGGANNLQGGLGNDTLYSANGSDSSIFGGAGQDTITVNASSGQHFFFDSVSDSTSTDYDIVTGMNFDNADFNIGQTVSAIDTAVTTGTLDTGANFDADLAAAIGAGQLGANDAVLFTVDSSSTGLAGHTFLIVDMNGAAGYQAGADLVIDVTGYTGTLTAGEFF